MSDIWVHLPVDERNVPPMPLASRPDSLKGLKVGLLENGKEFSQEVHEGLQEVLVRDYDVGDVQFWHKGFPAKAAPFIDDMAKDCDVVISGVGH
ncbi:MAG: hypothetical protein VW802_09135 [Rhodospirillaceae bacterium]